jgi:hypothetical protein
MSEAALHVAAPCHCDPPGFAYARPGEGLVCGACGRPRAGTAPPPPPPSRDEWRKIIELRAAELLGDGSGPSVLNQLSVSLTAAQTRALVDTLAQLVADRRSGHQERPELKDWNGVKETAAYLGVSEWVVYRHKDRIGSRKRGGRVEFSREAVMAYELAGRRR